MTRPGVFEELVANNAARAFLAARHLCGPSNSKPPAFSLLVPRAVPRPSPKFSAKLPPKPLSKLVYSASAGVPGAPLVERGAPRKVICFPTLHICFPPRESFSIFSSCSSSQRSSRDSFRNRSSSRKLSRNYFRNIPRREIFSIGYISCIPRAAALALSSPSFC